MALEVLERPEAKERQARRGRERSSELFERAAAGRTDEKFAEAVGMEKDSHRKAKMVVEAAQEPPELRPVVEEMDRSGKVEPAFKEQAAAVARFRQELSRTSGPKCSASASSTRAPGR